ncbi:MAG: BtpA/SgcQ family protein [Deltaproteobacteria bacterium]|nr:BtpA/SgcQ family protein [Deltaproteobacteria bacterium]
MSSRTRVPALVGVIHLGPLCGSPRYGGALGPAIAAAERDARALEQAGFEAAIVENYGDAPFVPGRVEPATVAAMTAAALAVRAAAPRLLLGVNVLRNDALSALGVAAAAGASFVRINVHVGVRASDQGILQGQAHETLRARRRLALDAVALLCDVAVKHSAPVGEQPLAEQARELAERGLADAVLVTGPATGSPVAEADLDAVLGAVAAPVLVASGVTAETLSLARRAHGVIVGSSLRRSGRAGDPIDPELARRFAEAWRAAR